MIILADIVAAAVLSGNRNFEGRVHPLTRANYLASPPLVVAYALAGTVCTFYACMIPCHWLIAMHSCCFVSFCLIKKLVLRAVLIGNPSCRLTSTLAQNPLGWEKMERRYFSGIFGHRVKK